MSFGDRLKEARLKKGLKQTELSNLVGLTQNAVSNYETKVSFPNIEVLYKLMRTLDVDPNFLFQDEVKIENNVLTIGEKDLIDQYRNLNSEGQQKAKEYIDDLTINPKYMEQPSASKSDIAEEVPSAKTKSRGYTINNIHEKYRNNGPRVAAAVVYKVPDLSKSKSKKRKT